MKCITLLLLLAGLHVSVRAQQAVAAGNTVRVSDTTLPQRISQKLTDSLNLSFAQSTQIRAATQWIDSSKIAIIRQYHGTDSLNIGMYLIERQRDSLYQTILTDPQFVQYGLHKMSWVLNN